MNTIPFLETVAGEALSILWGSKTILQFGAMGIRSPFASVKVLLSSRTELRFSIQIASTGPSRTIQMWSPIIRNNRKKFQFLSRTIFFSLQIIFKINSEFVHTARISAFTTTTFSIMQFQLTWNNIKKKETVDLFKPTIFSQKSLCKGSEIKWKENLKKMSLSNSTLCSL